MNRYLLATGAALLALQLTACDKGKGDDKLADKVENAADARADAMENQADAMNEQADQVRETGEARADAIDAADVNANAMTGEKKDAIVANEAPAVR